MPILNVKQVSDQVHDKAQYESSESKSSNFVVIPIEDRRLVRKHGGLGLQDYWLDCWEADPYGSRYVLMPDADLKSRNQRKYRKQLRDLGLFMFEVRNDGTSSQLWVLNRHGTRSPLRPGNKEKTKHDGTQKTSRGTQNTQCDTQNTQRGTQNAATELVTLTQQDFQKPSISSQYLLNIFSTNNTNIAVVGEKNVDEKQPGVVPSSLASLMSMPEPLVEPISLGEATCPAANETGENDSNDEAVKPSPEETREVLAKLRELGIALNPTIQKLVRDYYSDVEMAIAHIKERVFRGEQFKNLAGAFCKAVKTSAKPEKALGGSIPSETNPPSAIQLVALEEAKNTGAIADYFFSSSGITKVVMPGGFHQMPWWEYLAER